MRADFTTGDFIEQLPDPDDFPVNGDYVSWHCDESELGGLLWAEVRCILRWASRVQFIHNRRQEPLTQVQRKVLNFWLRGHTDETIGGLCNLAESTIKTHRLRALKKCNGYPHKGLRTVMVETLGWRSVREHLSGRLQKKRSPGG